MKFMHTADWHLGKLIQGVYMTEDQACILQQFIEDVQTEEPDAVIIAGDLYDRAVPPAEAVELLNRTLEQLVLQLEVPVLAIAGHHDSPDRLDFGTNILAGQGLHLAGKMRPAFEPVVLRDEHGEVHFHLVPYADPAQVRHLLQDESIRSHDEAMEAIVAAISKNMDPKARHVFVGHAFVTPDGEKRSNTSDAERPLSIGGAEHVKAAHFKPFHYTALGHLHQAHAVGNDRIRYAGSPLKYSVSEANHHKGYYVVQIDGEGEIITEKKQLTPRRDMRRIEARMEEIEMHEPSDDYVFVTLLDEHPVLFPMEKVRAVYPNALHVERKLSISFSEDSAGGAQAAGKREQDPVRLFAAFYEEVKGVPLDEAKRQIFEDVLEELRREEGEWR